MGLGAELTNGFSQEPHHCPFYTTTQTDIPRGQPIGGHLTSVSATEVGKGLNPKGKSAKGPTSPHGANNLIQSLTMEGDKTEESTVVLIKTCACVCTCVHACKSGTHGTASLAKL